jgi:hypothetical protein
MTTIQQRRQYDENDTKTMTIGRQLLDGHNSNLKNCCIGRKHSAWRSRRRGEEGGGGEEGKAEGVAEGGADD